MKKLIVFTFALAVANPAHAFLGIGDVTFDPQSYGELGKIYQASMEMYKTAKQQLDSLASIEKKISEAQQAYDTLASFDLKQVAQGLKPDTSNTKSFAVMRAEVGRIEDSAGQNAGYVSYQLSRIDQLENLDILQRAAAKNTDQSTGKINQATSEQITAQSTATLAALGAAEEQRRVQEDYAKAAGAKAVVDSLGDSKNVYEAMGR